MVATEADGVVEGYNDIVVTRRFRDGGVVGDNEVDPATCKVGPATEVDPGSVLALGI